jgi:hypothetical protein
VTIQNQTAFLGSLPDWSILDGCFGNTQIHPTDVDGCVERKGVCLFLEAKKTGVGLGQGQLGVFKALVRQGNTVIVFWGSGLNRAADANVTHMVIFSQQGNRPFVPADLDDLRDAVAAWYRKADGAE